MILWLLLGLGGAAGAVARYVVSIWVQRQAGPGFPWGTLTVNVAGSFALGLLLTALGPHPLRPMIITVMATGFLGDFTTFSTFAYEASALGHARAWGRAAGYVLGTTVATFAAAALGMAAGAQWAALPDAF